MTRRRGIALALALWAPVFGAEMREYVIELESVPGRASRERILEEQRRVREELARLGIRVVSSTVVTSNTLVVKMPDELLPEVESLPGVKRVRRARSYQRR